MTQNTSHVFEYILQARHNHETHTRQQKISVRYGIRLKPAITRQGLVTLPQDQENTCLTLWNTPTIIDWT